MKYSILSTDFRDFRTISRNELPPRAYFIPFGSEALMKKSDKLTERYKSDRVTCLSGEWDFRFYKSLSKLPESIDTDRLRFDKVSVPSTWQRTGYSSPVYLNCDYEFRTAPPELPEDMQAAIYKKTFDVGELSGRYILATLGISPCADIYLNGEFVGYREGSHNTACFDLTDKMRAGENELLIVVYKWCTGSFLECQDMFREQGIFRDVLLYHCPDT
ncbi:MAG: beta-galactosidase, partial [Clostridia bacterium]|nr:beta-galactosidase [Clostridia bacterium]